MKERAVQKCRLFGLTYLILSFCKKKEATEQIGSPHTARTACLGGKYIL